MVDAHGVLFDIDDTLVDTMAAFDSALRAVAAVHLPPLGQDGHEAVLAQWRADPSGHYRSYTRGELTFHQQRHRRVDELHERFGGSRLDEPGYREWSEVFDAAFEAAWAAFPESAPTVLALRAAGIAVGALSNATAATQQRKLAVAGLGEHVPLLVTLDTLGFGKPDPRVFHEACRRLGTRPERTVYVGDELDIDAAAATAAGLHGVWLDRRGVGLPEQQAPAVTVLSSLAGLPAVVGL